MGSGAAAWRHGGDCFRQCIAALSHEFLHHLVRGSRPLPDDLDDLHRCRPRPAHRRPCRRWQFPGNARPKWPARHTRPDPVSASGLLLDHDLDGPELYGSRPLPADAGNARFLQLHLCRHADRLWPPHRASASCRPLLRDGKSVCRSGNRHAIRRTCRERPF